MSRFSHPRASLLILLSCLTIATATVVVKADLLNRMHQAMLDAKVDANGQALVARGRDIFRNDTFGDEDFWGGTLKLHQAIEGAANGGVGPGVSPRTALAVGLKVDAEALPEQVVQAIQKGLVNLDDPKTTL